MNALSGRALSYGSADPASSTGAITLDAEKAKAQKQQMRLGALTAAEGCNRASKAKKNKLQEMKAAQDLAHEATGQIRFYKTLN